MWLTIACILVVFVGFTAFLGAPYVPSKRRDVERALTELYKLSAKDLLVDLGSGDGIVLRIASKFGARAVGFEVHPFLVWLSRRLSRADNQVRVELASFWRAKLPDDVTVVYVFADSRDIKKVFGYLQREANRLDKTLSLISYGFKVATPPLKTVGAHHLYRIKPLHAREVSL